MTRPKKASDLVDEYDDDPSYEEHPLFPGADGSGEFPKVAFIHVIRIERNGSAVWSDELFKFDELTSLSQLAERYGGGKYLLKARTRSRKDPSKPAGFSAQASYTISGRSKPLGADTEDEPLASSAPQGATQSGFSSHAGGDSNVMISVIQMMQNQAQMAAQQSQAFMAMMVSMMTSQQSSAKSEAKTIVDTMSAMMVADKANMAQFYGSLAQRNGGSDADTLLKGLQLGLNLGKEEDDQNDAQSSTSEILQGIQAIASLAQGAGKAA